MAFFENARGSGIHGGQWRDIGHQYYGQSGPRSNVRDSYNTNTTSYENSFNNYSRHYDRYYENHTHHHAPVHNFRNTGNMNTAPVYGNLVQNSTTTAEDYYNDYEDYDDDDYGYYPPPRHDPGPPPPRSRARTAPPRADFNPFRNGPRPSRDGHQPPRPGIFPVWTDPPPPSNGPASRNNPFRQMNNHEERPRGNRRPQPRFQPRPAPPRSASDDEWEDESDYAEDHRPSTAPPRRPNPVRRDPPPRGYAEPNPPRGPPPRARRPRPQSEDDPDRLADEMEGLGLEDHSSRPSPRLSPRPRPPGRS
ncbi:hypothetical protein CC1G_11879 [Coprinopsis cinerea okayama7|uniref:Uncharacterized protein n=1 Tax=Coprinopsis cinerea (strain Okayama-7 / 130 / ATCC MYA-4618 / FGSC 9003) TaxID=240176 RepID=A8NJL9_COPC7|nr:hypothetical protein CC1G_11879 [Coprinopsis cinerea okayama7\|eukprot:XP_001834258.2 hypothetical protein CC1G_11879 [Coprinopsis cinerea okayama7\